MKPLAGTPLHPQWLIARQSRHDWAAIASRLAGRFLDIGCGDNPLARWLSPAVDYIGLDYPPTVAKGYAGMADVFGDGQRLPFGNACFDAVAALDVLEHLPRPEAAFAEMVRVARPGALIVTRTPFMYPLHDLPHDFHRWTSEGLKDLGRRHGVTLISFRHYGRSLETAALLLNLALANGLLDAVTQRRPAMVLLPLAAFAVPVVNLCGWLAARCFRDEDFLPMGYCALFRKPGHAD